MKFSWCVFLFLNFSCLTSQDESFCTPLFIEILSDEIIQEIPKKDLKKIKVYDLISEKDWLTRNEINLNEFRIINNQDLIPIIDFIKKERQTKLNLYRLERIITEYTFNKIQNKHLCLKDIIEKQISLSVKRNAEITNRIEQDSIDGIYIPKDLKDAIKELKNRIRPNDLPKVIEFSKSEFDVYTQFFSRLGNIRNSWGLWGKSRLSVFFENRGIVHPEDISGIVLTSLYRSLQNIPVGLEEQVQYYLKDRLKNNPPSKLEFPLYVNNVVWYESIGYPEDSKEKEWAEIHFFQSLDQKINWIYNYQCGWKQISKKQLRESRKLYDFELKQWIDRLN